MSTGKRLAKRSIVGTRVCAQWLDDIYYSGVIQAVKTPSEYAEFVDTTYSVRFEEIPVGLVFGPTEAAMFEGLTPTVRTAREYRDVDLIGPGFRTMSGIVLKEGQKVFLTYNGREVSGTVVDHNPDKDEVVVCVVPQAEGKLEVKKKLEEVRLLESRKSARLMDQDTDFARLADMAGDRKRTSSHSIEVPMGQGSRKRRTSTSNDEKDPDCMNECTAALVLMSLSCSPHSPNISGLSWAEPLSPSPSSDISSWRSGGRSPTPSPPLSDGGSSSSIWNNATDEGIVIDEFDDIPKKKRPTRVVFRCTWPGCRCLVPTLLAIENHVRQFHLGGKKDSDDSEMSDHEEEFYYTEVELPGGLNTASVNAPPAVHPHKDMCRPPHEDPEYQKPRTGSSVTACHPNTPWSSFMSLVNCQKQPKLSALSSHATSNSKYETSNWLSSSAPNKLMTNGKAPGSPTRKARGETKKCRKVYGMEHRELWCTQCKWKKACSRFGD